MTQLAHRARFNLSNALAGQVECLTNFFECSWLTTIETETQRQNFALAFVEWRQQASDFFGQQRSGSNFERRFGRAVFDNVAKFGIAVFTQRL